MKTILVLFDGLGDRVYPELGDKTPLEAAHTPHLDSLCKKAETGMMIPYRQGVPLGTETAHFLLYGYELTDFPGRGAIEALGEGIPLQEDEVYLRCCFATVEENHGFYFLDRYARELTPEEINELTESIPKEIQGVKISWKYSFDMHGIITLKGENISSAISDSDPHFAGDHVIQVEPFETKDSRAVFTAGVVNRFLVETYNALKEHPVNKKRVKQGKPPANFIISKWAGRRNALPPFHEKHGISSLILGASDLLKGVTMFLGMDFEKCSDFGQGIQKALKADYDFVQVHTKEPDEAAHTKKPVHKKEVIEKLDRTLAPLLDINKEEILLVVTADHSTPSCGTLVHSGEPVPIMFIGKGVRVDDVQTFGERSCAKGSIRMDGRDLIPMVLNFTDRALLYGLRTGGRRTSFVPGKTNILKQ